MNKLLSAGFIRLKKDKTFWTGVVFMALFGLFLVQDQYFMSLKYGTRVSIDSIFFAYPQFIGILSAVFSSLFLGTEYSDGTIRNKLIVGHQRSSIYLSSLFLSMTATFFMILAYLLPVCLIGIWLIGAPAFSFGEFAWSFFIILALTLAYCAIFTLISMLIQKRAVAAVAALLCSLILLFGGAYLISALDEPATTSDYSFSISEDGEENIVKGPEIPNPRYVSGTKRNIYEFLRDFLPSGQALQTSQGGPAGWMPPVYSLILVFLTTGGGILVFRKKNLN